MSAQIIEFTDSAGTNASPLDATGTANSFGTSMAIPTSTTTTAAHELAVTAYGTHFTSATKNTISAGTGFTQAGNYGNGVKQLDNNAFDYELDTGASSGITVTDTVGSTNSWTALGVIATFKIATAAAAFIPARPLVVGQALSAGAFF